MVVCNEMQHLLFAHLSLSSNQAKWSCSLPNALRHEVCALGISSLTPTSNVFSIVVSKFALSQTGLSGSQLCQGDQCPIAISQITQNKKLEASNWQNTPHSVKEHHPQPWFSRKSNSCPIPTQSSLQTRLKQLLLCDMLWGHQVFALGFNSLKPTQNCHLSGKV